MNASAVNGPLRVGLIGCGHIAATHVAAWRQSDLADIAGVFDVNMDAAQRFAGRFGVTTVYPTVAAAVAGADIVDDCSPPAAHRENALAALRAGRHYLVEKPMVLARADLDEILAAREAAGRQLCVIHNLKYSDGVLAASRWVADGRIGQVLALDRVFLTDPSTDRMLRMPNHWSRRLPGGRWVETLPHELYLIHHFLGPLEVASVVALPGETSTPASSEADPATAPEVAVIMRGPSAVATLRYSSRNRTNQRRLTLYGSEGTILVDILAGSATLLRQKDSAWVRAVGGQTLDAATTLARMVPDRLTRLAGRLRHRTAHSALIRDFARSVRGDGPPPVSLDEIAYVVDKTEEIGAMISASARGA